MRQMQIISVSNSSEKLMLIMVSRLRRLFRNVLRTTKLPNVITSSDVPESVHDVYLRSGVRRQRRAQQPNQPGSQERQHPDLRASLRNGKKLRTAPNGSKPIHHQPSQARAQNPAG